MNKFIKPQRLAGWGVAAVLLGGVCLAVLRTAPAFADAGVVVPAPALNPPDAAASETALLSGGCFWGLQGVYEHVKGVTKVYAGYAGGAADTAQYEVVSTGTTGHAETVQITFDPKVISYAQILQIYFSVATEPTELNYQGPDTGTQYRGEIWYESPEQAKVANAYIAQLSAAHTYGQPIVTRVDPAPVFYQAETYHQDFLVRHPDYPYIVYNDIPKVEALQKLFPAWYRAAAVTVLGAG
ncbi:MAG: peptide-methionine (S)-S-oxide reductase MsrA [Acidocella sp.]|nr:peptide-methionine (S)-S-oxide reductase MsrA [Acidocella sp.]MDE8350281.1 peptide-methionine (S)-S-oxide reductase MsrA [Acidocella sp.]